MHADPTYPLLPVFAFLGFVVGLIPLPWHLHASNAGTCVYMIWASLACLVQFVNSIAWRDTALSLAPVWCDISTKLVIGAGVGIPASTLCINRRLYKITSIRTVSVTRDERRRAAIVDLCISIGLPVLVMILHYVVQGHRFNILEGVGCLPEIFNTPPAYPLVFMWPPLIGCVSFVYAFMTLLGFFRHRVQFREVVSKNGSGMTISRYFRLMLLCLSEMICTIPIGAYSIYINTAGVHLAPWVSWANTHADFSHVEMVPAFIWRLNRPFLISVVMGEWVYVFAAFLFFALFGFADEARRHYKMAFWWALKWFGVRPKPKTQFNKLTLIKCDKPSPYTADCHSLPPYSPPARGTYTSSKHVDSLSSPTDAFGYVDLEKGLTDTKAPDLQSDSSPDYAESTHAAIIISDELPPSTPPTPVDALRPLPAAVVPSYHRPLSPSTGWHTSSLSPCMSIPRKGSAGSISIMVHTESTTF